MVISSSRYIDMNPFSIVELGASRRCSYVTFIAGFFLARLKMTKCVSGFTTVASIHLTGSVFFDDLQNIRILSPRSSIDFGKRVGSRYCKTRFISLFELTFLYASIRSFYATL